MKQKSNSYHCEIIFLFTVEIDYLQGPERWWTILVQSKVRRNPDGSS